MLNSLKVAFVEFANGKYQIVLCTFTFTKLVNPYRVPEETRSSLRNASRIHPHPRPPTPGGGGHTEKATSLPLITSGFSF